jgi:hypothetical protein
MVSSKGKRGVYGPSHHNVRNIVRERSHDKEGKYLEFDVKQGWGPLCHFLGKDVPKEDFPRIMERDDFREVSKNVRIYEIILMAGNVAKWLGVGGVWEQVGSYICEGCTQTA